MGKPFITRGGLSAQEVCIETIGLREKMASRGEVLYHILFRFVMLPT